MEKKEPKKVEYNIPEKVIENVEGIIKYPSIIETDFYVKGALDKILEYNELLWSKKYFDGYSIQFNEGLVQFNDGNLFLYFKKRIDETTYKFFMLFPEESSDSVLFMLQGLKKFKTI